MLCFETNKETTSVRSSSIALMYRNLPSDTSQPSTDANYFHPTYNQRINQPQSYPPTTFGATQTTFTAHDHGPPGSGLNPEYSSQFFVSDLNPSFHGEGTPAHCSWGAGGFYPADTLHSGMNSWDPATQSFSHIHSGGLGSPSISGFSASAATGQSSLLEASEASALPSASLAGIDCFSTVSDAGSSGSFHLPVMPHRTLPSQRRPYEWINKNAYQNPQTQQGKTRTKDKYRVVYSDHQRLELEKEFRFSRYITIRRKAELASQLCLSERQVKIWFQNRRAKERKASKKSTNASGNSGEEQDGMDDGDASDNSGQGVESPSAIASLSPASSQQQQPGLILGFNPRSDTTSGVGSPLSHPQDGANDVPSHSSQLQYPYPMESPRHAGDFGSLPVDVDIKPPLLTNTDDVCCVPSSVDDVRPSETGTSSENVENDLRRL